MEIMTLSFIQTEACILLKVSNQDLYVLFSRKTSNAVVNMKWVEWT